MVAGLGLFTVSSVAGTIYFIVHHAFVKACLFLTAGVAEEITGTKALKKMGGLLGLYPALGFLFFLPAMSLAGVPPLSGFFGKLMLLLAAADLKNYWMIACAMVVGVLTLFSMVKIFMYAYWGTPAQAYAPADGFLPARGIPAGAGVTEAPDSPDRSAVPDSAVPDSAVPDSSSSAQYSPRTCVRRRYLYSMIPIALLGMLTACMGLFAQPALSLCTEAAEQMMDPQYYIDAVMHTVGGRY